MLKIFAATLVLILSVSFAQAWPCKQRFDTKGFFEAHERWSGGTSGSE